MTALIAPISGSYTATFNSNACGIMDDKGFQLIVSPQAQMIDRTDQFGMTLIEMIYLGMNVRMRFRCKEWNSGMQGIMQNYGKVSAGVAPSIIVSQAANPIGAKASSVANTLVLTSTASTPAASSPASLTASLAVLAPNSQFDMNFTSAAREVPLELVLIPYASSNINIPFSTAGLLFASLLSLYWGTLAATVLG